MRQSSVLRQNATGTVGKTPQRRRARSSVPGAAPARRGARKSVSGPGAVRYAHIQGGNAERLARRNRWKRRVFFLGLAAVLLCALFLPLQIKAWRLQSELNQLQSEKQALLLQQQQIQQQIGYYSSDAYVEEAARQDLGLVKPGEALVLPAVPGATKPLPKNYHASIAGPYGD
ncbi:MAG: septum formation initiator family protein [Thermacetogeniaceae bacterium]